MKSDNRHIALILAALILWAPLVEGGTTYLGWTISRLLALALATLVLWRAAKAGEMRVARHFMTAAIALLFLALTFSAVWADYSFAAMTWLMNFGATGIVLLAATMAAENEKPIGLALIVSAVFEAIWGLVEYFAFPDARPNGTFFNPNYLGGYLAMVSVWVFGDLAFNITGRNSPGRDKWHMLALKILTFLLVVGGVLVTASRGAALALFVGLFVVGVLRWGLKIIPGLAVVVLLLLLVPNPLTSRLHSLADTDIYAYSRLFMWRGTFEMAADHPMGVGLGMYRFYSPPYAFPVEKAFARYGQVAEMAHNTYLDILAELGPGTLAVLVAAGIYLFLRGYRLRKKARNGAALGALGAVAVFAVHAAGDSIHKSPPSLFAAAMFAGMLLGRILENAPRLTLKMPPRARFYLFPFAVIGLWAILSPFLGYTFFEKAKQANRTGDWKSAAAWLSRALYASPGDASLWRSYGMMESARWKAGQGSGHFGEALEALRTAQRLNPLDSGYPVITADLLLMALGDKPGKGALLEILRYYRRAIELEPFNPFHRVKAAQIFDMMGDYKAAKEEYRKAIDMEPRFAAAMAGLGDLLVREGKKTEAAFYYKSALEIAAKPPPAPLSNYVRAMLDFDVESTRVKLKNIHKIQ